MRLSGEHELETIARLYTTRRTAVLTGPAALRVMGVKTLSWVTSIDLVLRGTTKAKRKDLWGSGVVYRSGRLEDGMVVSYKGFQVVTLIRALFDTYRYYGRTHALVSIESALQLPQITNEYLLAQASSMPRSQGIRGFRALLEYASPRSESPLETLARDTIIQAALPGVVSVEQQVPFTYGDSWGMMHCGRADMEINGCIVVEVDGRAKSRGDWEHVTREERERERWLMHGDKVLIRATWEEVVSGELVERVSNALELTGFARRRAG